MGTQMVQRKRDIETATHDPGCGRRRTSHFQVRRTADEFLVLWPVAESPLESAPIERVQFGVDEHSNVLWALERIIDGRQVDRAVEAAAWPQPPRYPAPEPIGDTTKAKSYLYIPAVGIPSRMASLSSMSWDAGSELLVHPAGPRGLLATASAPNATSRSRSTQGGHAHHAGVSPGVGSGAAERRLRVERRWQLARDMQGGTVPCYGFNASAASCERPPPAR